MVSESPGISRPATPAWIDHAIWWQVYPLGATGAPIRPEPDAPLTEPGAPARLDRLEPWLDYAVELGANGLSLGPIFRSATHGCSASLKYHSHTSNATVSSSNESLLI